MLPSKQEHRRVSHPAEQWQVTRSSKAYEAGDRVIQTISIVGMGRISILIIWRGQVLLGHKGISPTIGLMVGTEYMLSRCV